MRANELMIGDWINLKNGKVIMPCRITVIGHATQDRNEIGTTVCVDLSKEFPTCIFDMDVITPIPLTQEILEKNGFHINGIPNSITSVKAIDDWSDDTYVWSRQETPDERMFVSVYMDDPANFFVEVYCQYCHVDGIHVKYLHELQHALKLCGIGIEIRL